MSLFGPFSPSRVGRGPGIAAGFLNRTPPRLIRGFRGVGFILRFRGVGFMLRFRGLGLTCRVGRLSH